VIVHSSIFSTFFLRTSSPAGLYLWCAVGLCSGLYLFFQGFRLLQRRQLILNTPVSKIRSASMGMVELSGLAVGPYTVTAPVTSRPCYYYRTLVWEWKQSGKNKRWVKVAAECSHVPFFLDDNTGQVMIDPRGADLDLHRDFQQEFCDSFFTTKEEVPPNVHSFLARHGVMTNNKIKVEEFCIKPKNALFVLGTLDDNPGLELTPDPILDDDSASFGSWTAPFSRGTAALRESAQSRVHDGLSLTGGLQHDPAYDQIYNQALSKTSARVIQLSPEPVPMKATEMSQQQKIAAALMKSGISTPAAWVAAGTNPSSSAVDAGSNGSSRTNSSTEVPPLAGFDPHPAVVLMKGKNNPTFMISWRSQRDLARSLGWKCMLMIWGGPALALLSLFVLLSLPHTL
jgi:E3 Ubiquitin ligase